PYVGFGTWGPSDGSELGSGTTSTLTRTGTLASCSLLSSPCARLFALAAGSSCGANGSGASCLLLPSAPRSPRLSSSDLANLVRSRASAPGPQKTTISAPVGSQFSRALRLIVSRSFHAPGTHSRTVSPGRITVSGETFTSTTQGPSSL